MIKLQLMLIYDTDIVMSRFIRKIFNCRYNPRLDDAFCLLTLKSLKNGGPHYLVLNATSITKFTLRYTICTFH